MVKIVTRNTHGIFKYITDNGSNVYNNLFPWQMVSCANQNLNLIAREILRSGGVNGDEWISDEIHKTSLIVGNIKRAGDNVFENGSLKSHDVIQWNSEYIMLDSIITNSDEIDKRLNAMKCYVAKFLIENIIAITLPIDFLVPFKEVSDALEGDESLICI